MWFTKSKFEDQDMKWDSPWGRGYPGWHIECSAMAEKYLGKKIDLHTGGEDLLPIHHNNEIAQSEAATGCTFARYWMHAGAVRVNEEKMSKSLGNFVTLDTLFKEFHPEVIRFLDREFNGALELAKLGSGGTLLGNRPWLKESIYYRAPMIHPLNLLQIQALERESMNTAQADLFRETVTGIAAGMLTTG